MFELANNSFNWVIGLFRTIQNPIGIRIVFWFGLSVDKEMMSKIDSQLELQSMQDVGKL